MTFAAQHSFIKAIALAFVVFCIAAFSLSFMPERASAAAVSLSSATTTSSNASTTLAIVGDTVYYQLNLSGTPSATSSPVINIFGMGSTTMSGAGTAWTYSTTTTSSWSNGVVTFYMGWGGTAGEATTTISQSSLTGAPVVFDKTVPVISGITSNATAAGALKVGDTIVFTLATSTTENQYTTVSGSYNGESLTWAFNSVTGRFIATSTVTEGQTDRTTALQITGVIMTDAGGNSSSAGAGSDVAKTIDANSPSAPTATPQGGTIFGTELVSLASVGSDAVYYTTDGTTPTCSSTLFSTGISVSTSQTIKSAGCDNAGNISSITTSSYTVTSSQSGSGSTTRGGGGSSNSAAAATAVASGSKLSSSQVSSILGLLRSFGAAQSVIDNVNGALTGQASAGAAAASGGSFTRDLQTGASGDDVRALQVFLNTHGFPIAPSGIGSAGNETTYFGALTKEALAKFQAAQGITPAAGYFGPKTRAAISNF